MAGLLWLTVALVAGFGVYFLLPFVAIASRVTTRESIGSPYLKMGVRCLKQFAFVRRVLSGYDVLPISVDAEQKQLNVTLASKTLGDDQEYRFNDPDNRIKRLWNKPVAVTFELIPAALDAELAELGHWVREKRIDSGLFEGDIDEPEDVTVDPYVSVDDGVRLVDPLDAYELVPNDIDPENIKTAEAHTRQRYSKYGRAIGLSEIMGVLMGFGVGMVGMAGAAWVNQQFLDGGGASVSNPIDSFGIGGYVVPGWAFDLLAGAL